MISDQRSVAASAGRQCEKKRVNVTQARFYLSSDLQEGETARVTFDTYTCRAVDTQPPPSGVTSENACLKR